MSKHLIEIKNKQAIFEYFILNACIAIFGLYGTKIKSISKDKTNLFGAWRNFVNDELWVNGVRIAEYLFISYYNNEAKRTHKILLKK